MLLAGHGHPTVRIEAAADPIPVQAPTPVVPSEARDVPAAVTAHHDQAREVHVDLPQEGHEVRKLILVFHQPLGMLVAEDEIELRGQTAFVLRTVDRVGLVRPEDRCETKLHGFDRRAVPIDRLDPGALSLELLERGTSQCRDLDREDFHSTEVVTDLHPEAVPKKSRSLPASALSFLDTNLYLLG